MNKSLRAKNSLLLAILLPGFLLVGSMPASASQTLTLIAEDSFEYTGNMVGKNGGSGFEGAWSYDYGTSDYGTDAAGLTYPGLTTSGGYMYGCSSTPNVVCGIKREIPLQSSGIVYLQFLANFGTQTGGGTPMLRIFDESGALTAGIGANGGTYGSNISILDNTGNPPADGSASSGTINSETFVVVKIDYTNNRTSMWLNPNLSTFSYLNPPSPTVFVNGLAPTVKRLAFYSRVGYSKFDELKIYKITGTTAAEDQAALDADKKKRDDERQATIKIARDKINNTLVANLPVTIKDLADADLPIKSVDSLLLAYKELISIKYSLNHPLSSEEVAALKFNKFMKYAMYERMTGINSGAVFGRDLAKYGVFLAETPMKQLATYQLMKQPLSARDTIAKVNDFFAQAAKNFADRKAHLAATIIQIQSR